MKAGKVVVLVLIVVIATMVPSVAFAQDQEPQVSKECLPRFVADSLARVFDGIYIPMLKTALGCTGGTDINVPDVQVGMGKETASSPWQSYIRFGKIWARNDKNLVSSATPAVFNLATQTHYPVIMCPKNPVDEVMKDICSKAAVAASGVSADGTSYIVQQQYSPKMSRAMSDMATDLAERQPQIMMSIPCGIVPVFNMYGTYMKFPFEIGPCKEYAMFLVRGPYTLPGGFEGLWVNFQGVDGNITSEASKAFAFNAVFAVDGPFEIIPWGPLFDLEMVGETDWQKVKLSIQADSQVLNPQKITVPWPEIPIPGVNQELDYISAISPDAIGASVVGAKILQGLTGVLDKASIIVLPAPICNIDLDRDGVTECGHVIVSNN